jgi:hypothetical protein
LQVKVEFNALTKQIAGIPEIYLSLPVKSTYRDVVRELGKRFPEMIGIIIAPDGETFLSSNLFAIDGDLANPAMLMDLSPADGECIQLLSVITGG